MNREETKVAIKVMEHYANGGEVEIRDAFSAWQWSEEHKPSWNWGMCKYRIKKAISDDFMKKIESVVANLGDGEEVEFLVPNEQSSKELQDLLFGYGYTWANNWTNHVLANAPCLLIREETTRITGHAKAMGELIKKALTYCIDLENETIKDLRPKVEELTVAEIEAKLGYKVKIVKEN